jgi:hypothetical protein
MQQHTKQDCEQFLWPKQYTSPKAKANSLSLMVCMVVAIKVLATGEQSPGTFENLLISMPTQLVLSHRNTHSAR